MVCREIMEGASDKQRKSKMDCPIMIHPKCHPNANFLVHADGKKRLIYLSCSKCDRLVQVVSVKRNVETKQ